MKAAKSLTAGILALNLLFPASVFAAGETAPLKTDIPKADVPKADAQAPTPQPGEFILVAQRVPAGAPDADADLNKAVVAGQALSSPADWTKPVAKPKTDVAEPCNGASSAAPAQAVDPSKPLETRVFVMKADPAKVDKKVSQIPWPEHSHTAGWSDAALIFAGGAVAAGVTFGVKPVHANWGTNPVDTGILNAVGMKTPAGRKTIANISDIGFYSMLGLPIVETLAMLPRDSKTAWNYFVMSAEAMSLLGATSIVSEHVTGRERPYLAHCGNDPSFKQDCGTVDNPLAANGKGDYQSFYSGHTAMTTVSATLSCIEHYRLGLFQNKALDITHCALMEGIAAADGMFRMMAYRHNPTDVAVGWASGVGTAFLIDYLWHGPLHGYAQNREEQKNKLNIRVAPEVTSNSAGLMVMGTW